MSDNAVITRVFKFETLYEYTDGLGVVWYFKFHREARGDE